MLLHLPTNDTCVIFFFQVGGPMTKILVLKNKPVFKGLFIHLIGCEYDQDLGPPFSHVFKLVGHWSTYLEKKNAYDPLADHV